MLEILLSLNAEFKKKCNVLILMNLFKRDIILEIVIKANKQKLQLTLSISSLKVFSN